MTSDAIERVAEPGDGNEQEVLLGWLAFFRDALQAKCAGIDATQLVTASAAPSTMTLLGLVRHLTEMERVYAVYALGGGELEFVYGDYVDGGPEWDFDVAESMVDASFDAWRQERRAADELIGALASLDVAGSGNGRSARWNLHKLVDEYARHLGHADIVRQAIDGATGE